MRCSSRFDAGKTTKATESNRYDLAESLEKNYFRSNLKIRIVVPSTVFADADSWEIFYLPDQYISRSSRKPSPSPLFNNLLRFDLID